MKKADALAEFDSYVLTSKEKQYKQRVAPAPSQEQDVTVCVANSRQITREATSDFETASTASVGSAIPSPTSTGSRTVLVELSDDRWDQLGLRPKRPS